jgi:hypothetical protein
MAVGCSLQTTMKDLAVLCQWPVACLSHFGVSSCKVVFYTVHVSCIDVQSCSCWSWYRIFGLSGVQVHPSKPELELNKF